MKQPIGYSRGSADDQSLDLQRDALIKGLRKTIDEEDANSKSAGYPQLAKCLKALRAGDTLVVWCLNRLGRSLPDPVKIIGELERQGVTFESLSEEIETSSATGKQVLHVFAASAEFDRNLIRKQAKTGLDGARPPGRKVGRKPSLSNRQKREIKALLRDPNARVSDVAKKYGVSRTTLYRHVGVVQPRAR